MKKVVLLSVLAVFCMAGNAFGQSTEKNEKKKSKLGSFIRKVGESTTGINMSNETFVAMDFDAQKLIELEVLSCKRDSTTQAVLLTLGVKARQNGIKTALGKPCGSGNEECVNAYDAKGNLYVGQEVGTFTQISGPKENPVGIPVKYEFVFSDLPTTLSSIEVVQIEFYVYSRNGGNVGSNMSKVEPIQVRNIPVQ